MNRKNPRSQPAKLNPSPHRATERVVSAGWQGPLPPPQALEAFETAHPGSAERIITMAEREQAAQVAIVQRDMENERSATQRGQWLGFLLPVLFGAGSVAAVVLGAHPSVSVALATVPAIAAITAIVQGRKGK